MRGFIICALALAFYGADAKTYKVSDINAFNKAVKVVLPGDSRSKWYDVWNV
jgi:hypothetical protein